jgi:hypothetical protein
MALLGLTMMLLWENNLCAQPELMLLFDLEIQKDQTLRQLTN